MVKMSQRKTEKEYSFQSTGRVKRRRIRTVMGS